MLGGINAGSDESCGDFADLTLHVFMHQLCRDGMKINNAIDTVIGLLESHKLPDGTEVIAQMQIAGWLDAGENQRLEFIHDCFRSLCVVSGGGRPDPFKNMERSMHAGGILIKRNIGWGAGLRKVPAGHFS